jgi:hypothetical protein
MASSSSSSSSSSPLSSSVLEYVHTLTSTELIDLIPHLPNFTPTDESPSCLSSVAPWSPTECLESVDEYFLSRDFAQRCYYYKSLPISLQNSMKLGARRRQQWRRPVLDSLLLAFSYLSCQELIILLKINKYWRIAAQHPRVWSNSELEFNHVIPAEQLKNLQGTLQYLHGIILSERGATEALCNHISYITSLRVLTLTDCLSPPIYQLNYLAKYSKIEAIELFPDLTRDGLYLSDAVITELAKFSSLLMFAIHFPAQKIDNLTPLTRINQLNSVILDSTGDIDSLMQSMAYLRGLESLNLRYCKLHDGHLSLLRNFPNLLALDIQQEDITQITSKGLSTLLSCRALRFLNMAYRECITDETILTLSQLDSLQILNLNGCFGFSARGLMLLTLLSEITHIGLQGTAATDELLLAAERSWRKLTAIDCSNCNNVSEIGIKALLNLPAITGIVAPKRVNLTHPLVSKNINNSLNEILRLPMNIRQSYRLYEEKKHFWARTE